MAPSCHIAVTPPHQPCEEVGDVRSEAARLFAPNGRGTAGGSSVFPQRGRIRLSKSNCFLKSHSAYSLTKNGKFASNTL